MSTPLTRRTLFRGAGAVGLGVVLASCSSGNPAPGAGGDPGSPGVRTIAHKYGSTEITGTPQRVVTVGLTEQDYVLALGIVPVGVREWFGEQPGALWPWATEAAGPAPAPAVLPTVELNFEQIASLEPDLILGINSGLTKQDYDTLTPIAPTVAQPVEFADYGAPWQTITETVGIAVGRPDEAAALIPDIDRQFADIRSANPGFEGRTALLAALLEDGTYYIYAEGPAPAFLIELGFTLPPAAAALFTGEERPPVALAQEQLGVLEADVLVIGAYGDTAAGGMISDPVFQGLGAAREGRVIVLPETSAANGSLTFGSVLSLPEALETMEPLLAAAVDGDPATAVPAVA